MADLIVLCYHAVSERWKSDLSVSTPVLRRQVSTLLERGYQPATLRDALADGGDVDRFVVTFDDGFASVFEVGLPVLESLGVPATVFVCTDFVTNGEVLDWPQLAPWKRSGPADEFRSVTWEVAADAVGRGWEIGSHTCSHPLLTTVDDDRLEYELVASRDACESRLGTSCVSFAYPQSDVDARVIEFVEAAGYTWACTLPDRIEKPAQFAWPRIGAYEGDGRRRFWLKSSPLVRRLRGSAAAATDVLEEARARRRAAQPPRLSTVEEVARETGESPFTHAHGWLSAAVPASAHRFRVLDDDLSQTLRSAGAELTDGPADVEIAGFGRLQGAADVAIVLPSRLGMAPSPTLVGRVVRRIARSLGLRVWLAGGRLALKRRGYREVRPVLFDMEQRVWVGSVQSVDRAAERFPRDGALIGFKRERPASLLDRVVEDASAELGRQLSYDAVTLRAGVLLVETSEGYLRVALGDSARQVRAQASALGELHELPIPGEVRSLLPAILASGQTGLTDWTLERKLPGRVPSGALDDSLLEECVTFLVRLGGAGRNVPGDATTPRLGVIKAAVDGPTAARVEAIARSALETVAGLDTVYAHGDFCSTNLLVEDGRLSGVIDWDGASAQRLPLLDLYHLLVLNTPYPDVYEWGSSIVTRLVPLARAGGNDQTEDYLDRLGLSLDADALSALVALYWLDRNAYQFAMYASRSADDRWLRRNVVEPALALSAD